MAKTPENKHLYLFVAICQFYLQQYVEAEESAMKGPANPLQNRILFHIAHRRGDESKLMTHHQRLTESQEDQLCLASIHYLRSHFQEVCAHRVSLCVASASRHADVCVQATDIYKRLLLENRDDLALNVYVAMCYYKVGVGGFVPPFCGVLQQQCPTCSWTTTTCHSKSLRCTCNLSPPLLSAST